MIYEYRNATGKTIERHALMADAPPVGHEIVVDGEVYRRIPSVPGVATGSPLRGTVSYTMDPRDAKKLGARVNKDGYVCFEGRREQDEFVSKTQDTENPVVNVR
jgi:hypothetical protein